MIPQQEPSTPNPNDSELQKPQLPQFLLTLHEASSPALLVDFSRCIKMEKETKKEAFRKYLESSGVLDALTKVLVALYEENDKPSSTIEFIQQKLGGPTLSEYEKLLAEKSDLQLKYDKLFATHQDICKKLEELRISQPTAEACDDIKINGETSKMEDHEGNSGGDLHQNN